MEFDSRKEAAIKELREKCRCHRCKIQGVNPIVGNCPRCHGTEIDPDKQEEYDRELKKIELDFSLN